MPVNTGKRFEFNPYGTGYIGAFFRNDEQGERIITGQQKRRDGTNERPQDLGTLGLWKAEVEEGNFIVLSSTPALIRMSGLIIRESQSIIRCFLISIREKMELMWKVGDVSISVWE